MPGESRVVECAEAGVCQGHRLEAMARLAGKVAHDFNNLLAVITGRSQLLLGRLPTDDPMRRHVELIEGAAQRGVALTKQLAALGRRQLLQPALVEVNAFVNRIAPRLREVLGPDVTLALILNAGPRRVRTDPRELEDALAGLAANGREAMPTGGRLTVEAAVVELDDAGAVTHSVAPGPYVALAVTDTGVGLPPAVRAHLFEPFVSTKNGAKGRGLGLATAYALARQSGGWAAVRSEPGEGTTVTLYLPVVGEEAPGGVEARPAVRAETVLLVEDDDGVRELAQEMLEAHGYAVLSFDHPEKALRAVEERTGPVHLLVTDMFMPRMSGRELARRLGRLHPALRVLYMSGYDIVPRDVLEPDAAFMLKPFSEEELVRKVRAALTAPPA